MEEKNLEKDRLVFFCDAVVAIAITLLVIDLKLQHANNEHLYFKDLLQPWHHFLAFLLSFFNIANFWKTHHSFYAHIKKIDEKLMWYNILWLLCIVLLPFTTSLVSNYFFDTAAMFAYSFNTLLVTLFQNNIWDYVSEKSDFLKDTMDAPTNSRFRLFCNLDMINAIIAIALSFVNTTLAFVMLLTKIPMMILAMIYIRRYRRKNAVAGEDNFFSRRRK